MHHVRQGRAARMRSRHTDATRAGTKPLRLERASELVPGMPYRENPPRESPPVDARRAGVTRAGRRDGRLKRGDVTWGPPRVSRRKAVWGWNLRLGEPALVHAYRHLRVRALFRVPGCRRPRARPGRLGLCDRRGLGGRRADGAGAGRDCRCGGTALPSPRSMSSVRPVGFELVPKLPGLTPDMPFRPARGS